MAKDNELVIQPTLLVSSSLNVPKIVDREGKEFPKRLVLSFKNAKITDDPENNKTIIEFD